MLIIRYGICDEMVYGTSKYFDYEYEPEWITKDISRKMIKDVDQSEILNENVILSPILGLISPQWLSGGVKTLMLMDNIDGEIFNGSQCGDNCAKWVLEISKSKDLKIRLGHYMDFSPYLNDNEFEILIEYHQGKETRIVRTIQEYLDIYNNIGFYYDME